MNNQKKRKAEVAEEGGAYKKYKGPKQWRVPRKDPNVPGSSKPSIEPGDAGIWATCDMHQEGRCIAELRELFGEYAEKLYGTTEDAAHGANDGNDGVDIEASIRGEINSLRTTSRQTLFQPVKIDMPCVVFFKTQAPIEPVSFIQHMCKDALQDPQTKRTRRTRRLTPMSMMGKATEKDLERVTKAVLAPHFHTDGATSKKFAIRTSIRNHTVLTRDVVIRQVAEAVGSPHTVDLTKYELLILVDIYKNMCGMSVVGSDYEELKRYNLAEIYNMTPLCLSGCSLTR